MFSNHDNLIIKLFFTRKNGTQINGNITTKVINDALTLDENNISGSAVSP